MANSGSIPPGAWESSVEGRKRGSAPVRARVASSTRSSVAGVRGAVTEELGHERTAPVTCVCEGGTLVVHPLSRRPAPSRRLRRSRPEAGRRHDGLPTPRNHANGVLCRRLAFSDSVGCRLSCSPLRPKGSRSETRRGAGGEALSRACGTYWRGRSRCASAVPKRASPAHGCSA